MTRETLTATGTTNNFSMGGNSNITSVYTLTGVSGSVVVSIEGTQDLENWVNLDENGSTTITADGTYAFTNIESAYNYVRFNWKSGTATNIVVSMMKNSG